MKNGNIFTAILAGLVLASGTVKAAPANVVQNGGFETGDFTDWTPTGDVLIDTNVGEQSEGSYSAALGSMGGTADLQQVVSTVPGTTYSLQFDYIDPTESYSQLALAVSGSSLALSETVIGQPAFSTTSVIFTADSTNTTIDFSLSNGGEVVIDNVQGYAGSFPVPGRFSGTLDVATSIPALHLSSFHLESVVGAITAGGAGYFLSQPSGEADSALFVSGSLQWNGSPGNFALKNKALTITTSGTNGIGPDENYTVNNAPTAITTRTYKLHWIGH